MDVKKTCWVLDMPITVQELKSEHLGSQQQYLTYLSSSEETDATNLCYGSSIVLIGLQIGTDFFKTALRPILNRIQGASSFDCLG